MGTALIILGIFLWFTLAFNGGVGEPFVNYAFFASALLMIITGGLILAKSAVKIIRYFCFSALVVYLPMIWQRFNFTFGPDWGGLYFDIGIVVFMLVVLVKKPGKAHEQGR